MLAVHYKVLLQYNIYKILLRDSLTLACEIDHNNIYKYFVLNIDDEWSSFWLLKIFNVNVYLLATKYKLSHKKK